MSEQVLIQFRADKNLKQEVSEIYEALGMDLPTAFRMFLVRSKAVGGLPFPATLTTKQLPPTGDANIFTTLRAQAADVPEMTLDEINDEIAGTRKR